MPLQVDGDADTMCADVTSVAGGSARTVDAIGSGPRPIGPVLPVEGKRIGDFTLQRRLGEGGMGVVFAAWSHKLARRVALKLPTRVTDAEVRGRIIREAQSLAGVVHPNVVQIYEIGEADGFLFIAMELVEGITLKRWQEEHGRGWRELLPMYVQAGRGLAAAHRQGLIHRDFKPSNTLVDGEGRVHLIDFGLARRRDTSSDLAPTVEGEPAEFVLSRRCGTPRYMAPELYETGATVDARSDQYSFCVALWEALFEELPDPRRTVPREGQGIPGWLVRGLRRGLSYRREDRYPSMDALLADLTRGLSPTRRRAPLAAALGAALSVAGGALVVGGDAPACVSARAMAAELRGAASGGEQGAVAERWFDAQVLDWAQARESLCGGALVGELRARAERCLEERGQALAGVREGVARGALEAWSPARWDAQLSLWRRALAPISDCVEPSYLERALGEEGLGGAEERAWLEEQIARGGALVSGGDFAAARSVLSAAKERAEAQSDPWRRARAELSLGIAAFGGGDVGAARRGFEAAAADAETAGDDYLAADAWRWLVFIDAGRGEPAAALRLAPLAAGKLRRIGQDQGPRWVDLALSTAWAELRGGDLDAARARVAEAVRQSSGVEEVLAARVLRHQAEQAHQRGEHPTAVDLARQSLALQVRVEGPRGRNVSDTRQSLARYEQAAGLVEEASADLQAAIDAATERADRRERASLDLQMATLRYAAGDLAAARAAAERAAAEFSALPDPESARSERIALAKLRGDVALESGDLDAAREHYRGGLALAPAAPLPEARDNLVSIRVGLGAAAHRGGDLAAAERALAEVLEGLARVEVDPSTAAFALGTAAEVDLSLGKVERAALRCREALARVPADDPLAPALRELLIQIEGR